MAIGQRTQRGLEQGATQSDARERGLAAFEWRLRELAKAAGIAAPKRQFARRPPSAAPAAAVGPSGPDARIFPAEVARICWLQIHTRPPQGSNLALRNRTSD